MMNEIIIIHRKYTIKDDSFTVPLTKKALEDSKKDLSDEYKLFRTILR